MKPKPDLNPFHNENPHTRQEWLQAAETARRLLETDATAYRWRMKIKKTGQVNVERCEDILRRARVLGIEP
jgi:hypothetical protein